MSFITKFAKLCALQLSDDDHHDHDDDDDVGDDGDDDDDGAICSSQNANMCKATVLLGQIMSRSAFFGRIPQKDFLHSPRKSQFSNTHVPVSESCTQSSSMTCVN